MARLLPLAKDQIKALAYVANRSLLIISSFVFLFLVLTWFGWNASLNSYASALLIGNITIAVFAINFSFLEYQLFPYRTLLRSAPPTQILFSIAILLSTVLIVGGVASNAFPIVLALVALPLVSCGGILLGRIARYEGSPLTMLEREASIECISEFLTKYTKIVDSHDKRLQEIKVALPFQAGMWYEPVPFLTPPVDISDPFNTLANLGILSIKNNDIHTYERVTERTLAAINLASELSVKDDDNNTNVLNFQTQRRLIGRVEDTMQFLGKAAIKYDQSDVFATKFMNICGMHVLQKADMYCSKDYQQRYDVWSKQRLEFMLFLMHVMVNMVRDMIGRYDLPSSLIPLTIARQAAEKGTKMLSKPDRWWSTNFASFIKMLGRVAIIAGNGDYVEHCLDDLGTLSRAAIKDGNPILLSYTLQSLVLLGRESNVNHLTFLSGYEQDLCKTAKRHLGYVWKNSEVELIRRAVAYGVERDNIVLLLSKALSRLHGEKHIPVVKVVADAQHLDFEPTGEAYTEQYSGETGKIKIADYSNPAFIKDLPLTAW